MIQSVFVNRFIIWVTTKIIITTNIITCNAPQTGFINDIELDTVSVHTSVVLTATIVFVTSDVTITIPADARTKAQIAPGIR